MKTVLHVAFALLAVAAVTACSDDASQPTAVDTQTLVASASVWTPSEVTRDLAVDDATRQKIEDGLRELHESMVALHEQHRALWESLDPEVQEILTRRLHERMREHDDGMLRSFHERMRSMHDAGTGH